MGKILGLSQMHFIILILVGAFVISGGKLPTLGAAAVTGVTGAAAVSAGTLGFCTSDTNTADINIKLSRSVLETDGDITNYDATSGTAGAGAQIVFEGASSAWQTVDVENGATSSNPDPQCGQKFKLVVRNDSYYNQSVEGLVAGSQGQYEVKGDLIAVQSLTADNSSSVGYATRQNTTISGTAGTYKMDLVLDTTTAQGVLRLNPAIICIRTNTTSNLDRTASRPIGATSAPIPGLCNGGGAASQITAWYVDKGVLKDTSKIKIPFEFRETSGNDAATNTIVEIVIVDKGSSIQNGVVTDAYVGTDQISDVGAASTVGSAATFTQYFGG